MSIYHVVFLFSYEERYRIINSIIRTHKKETTYEEFLAKSFTPLATKTLGKFSLRVLFRLVFRLNSVLLQFALTHFSSSVYDVGSKGGKRFDEKQKKT